MSFIEFAVADGKIGDAGRINSSTEVAVAKLSIMIPDYIIHERGCFVTIRRADDHENQTKVILDKGGYSFEKLAEEVVRVASENEKFDSDDLYLAFTKDKGSNVTLIANEKYEFLFEDSYFLRFEKDWVTNGAVVTTLHLEERVEVYVSLVFKTGKTQSRTLVHAWNVPLKRNEQIDIEPKNLLYVQAHKEDHCDSASLEVVCQGIVFPFTSHALLSFKNKD